MICNNKRPVIFIKNRAVDDREEEMMAVRWKIISFDHKIPKEKQRKVPACAKCFVPLLGVKESL